MHRLQQKLAIQVLKEQDSVHNIARQYRVYGMLQILERRRKVGMEYVVRHKGVDFVFPLLPGDATSPGECCHPLMQYHLLQVMLYHLDPVIKHHLS